MDFPSWAPVELVERHARLSILMAEGYNEDALSQECKLIEKLLGDGRSRYIWRYIDKRIKKVGYGSTNDIYNYLIEQSVFALNYVSVKKGLNEASTADGVMAYRDIGKDAKALARKINGLAWEACIKKGRATEDLLRISGEADRSAKEMANPIKIVTKLTSPNVHRTAFIRIIGLLFIHYFGSRMYGTLAKYSSICLDDPDIGSATVKESLKTWKDLGSFYRGLYDPIGSVPKPP